MRLDLAVARTLGLSRRAAREAVRAGRIDRDGKTVDEPGLDVPEGVSLSFHANRPARRRVRTRLSVLYEDDDVIVVDKPAGLLTVPTAERESDTLHARTLDYLQHRYGRRPYAGVVHRLDKDTSGALVFARNRAALHALQALFRAHDIEREYLAIVAGSPPESGILDADLVRDAGLGRRGVARRGEPGRRAVTRYRVLERLSGASLVSVSLETGRTHQIRVHFLSIGHPVVGDRVYRSRAAPAIPPEAARQMLHARRLGFAHPSTGASVSVQAEPAADFASALAALRRGVRRPAHAEGTGRPPDRAAGAPERGARGEKAPRTLSREKTPTKEKPRGRGAFRGQAKRNMPGPRRER